MIVVVLPLPFALLRWPLGLLVDLTEATPLWFALPPELLSLTGPFTVAYVRHRRARRKWLAAHPGENVTPAERAPAEEVLERRGRRARKRIPDLDLLPAAAFKLLASLTVMVSATRVVLQVSPSLCEQGMSLPVMAFFFLTFASVYLAADSVRKTRRFGPGRRSHHGDSRPDS